MNIFQEITRRIPLRRSLLLITLIAAAQPAHAILNGEGQDIFPLPAVFQSSATITYTDPANAGITVSSGLVVSTGTAYFGANLGIGTANPSSKLTVMDGDIRISTTSGSRGLIFQDGTSMKTLGGANAWTPGAGYIYNTMLGYVSIGTSNSVTPLYVESNTAGWLGMFKSSLTGGPVVYLANGAGSGMNVDAGTLGGSGNYALNVNRNGVPLFYVTTTGYAGVNTSSPDQALTVSGNISQTGVLISSGTGNDYFAGNVGIATNAPAARLDVSAAGSAQTDMAQIWRNSGGTIVSSMSAAGIMKAVRFEGSGAGLTELAGLIVSTGAINADLQAYKTTVQASTAAIAASTGAIQASLNAITLSTQPLALATDANIPNTLVKRDGAGNFAAGAITAANILTTGSVGLSTGVPQARLDVLAAGSAPSDMVQIWRDGGGNIVSSMSATGIIKAARFEGSAGGLTGIPSDNLGNHVATTTLQMGNYGIISSSDITAARYQIAGSTVLALTQGLTSLAVGASAGPQNTGGNNTFLGAQAGLVNSSAGNNTFLGALTGRANGNTAAVDNTFVGYYAGWANDQGYQNTFVGSMAGSANVGAVNGGTFVGYKAGAANNSGTLNTFVGGWSGYTNTSGSNNAFLGYYTGGVNTTGSQNTFVGGYAGNGNTTGANNSILGYNAAYRNAWGSANVIFGEEAGGRGSSTGNSFSSSTVMGYRAGYNLATGSGNNTLLGYQAGYNITNATGNIVIGYSQDTSAAGASNELNIGGVLFGKLDSKAIGIGRQAPQAALDVVSTAAAVYSQIWRDSGGNIVSTMTAGGTMTAKFFVGNGSLLTNMAGDGMGTETADRNLNMNGFDIVSANNISGARYQVNGSTVLSILPTTSYPGSSLAVGIQAGAASYGDFNAYVGYQSGHNSTSAQDNAFVGANTGSSNAGNDNSFLGSSAGLTNGSGSDNSLVGFSAGFTNSTGNNNTFFGSNAGALSDTGSDNTYLGYQAGAFASGSGNIVIGSGQQTADGANYDLNIGGALFGDLSAGNIGIGSRTYLGAYKFSVDGTGFLNDAAWTYSSDRRLKENIRPIQYGLAIVKQLKPVSFDYIKGEKKQSGFIAQDVQEALPAIVTQNSKGMLGVKIEEIIPYLVKAIQEQQKEIEDLKAELKKR